MDNDNYEKWFRGGWRPAVAWLYFFCVLFDFILAPIGYSGAQVFAGVAIEQWEPITLKGGGLFHISMLTIVGVTAYGRTKEKLKKISGNITLPEVTGD